MVHAQGRGEAYMCGVEMMSVLAQHEADVSQDVQKDSLMHFYRRLAHLNYNTIIKTARDPASGNKLTDELQEKRLACAQGKQTKNQQSRKDIDPLLQGLVLRGR